jgi:hypothetical protein
MQGNIIYNDSYIPITRKINDIGNLTAGEDFILHVTEWIDLKKVNITNFLICIPSADLNSYLTARFDNLRINLYKNVILAVYNLSSAFTEYYYSDSFGFWYSCLDFEPIFLNNLKVLDLWFYGTTSQTFESLPFEIYFALEVISDE